MNANERTIVAEISMYPLSREYKKAVIDFIGELKTHPGLEVITNQLSTQLRGSFSAVTGAIASAMQVSMSGPEKAAFIVKYLAADLDIGRTPDLE